MTLAIDMKFIGLRPMNVRNIRTPKGCEFATQAPPPTRESTS
jgi:hypothetical protein